MHQASVKNSAQEKGASEIQSQKRILKILGDKSGASLMFVLGIMLIFMTIGVSVLAAASANEGFVLEQKEHNRIMILDDSIHKNILYALQRSPTSTETMDNLLSTQLAKEIYNAKEANPADGLMPIQLDPTLDNGTDLSNVDITLSFPEQNVVPHLPIPAIYEDVYDISGNKTGETLVRTREPKTATVNATMFVTVEIKNADGEIVLTSRATYEYTGGKLSDDPDPLNPVHAGVKTNDVFTMDFAIDEDGEPIAGEWRLIKRENIDSVS